MKKKSNRDVIAPDQTVKGISNSLLEIGFTLYGYQCRSSVYSYALADEGEQLLFLFIDGIKCRMYHGFKGINHISARKLFDCAMDDLKDSLAALNKKYAV